MDMHELTPKQIVKELDKYIISQDKAKKAVAIALRNRWRRQNVSEELRDEILPNNIILIGPTGVGKTEISRRLANLVNAPFIKIEASKFTEVGYVGRDVESIIRELVSLSINQVREELTMEVEDEARERAEEKVLDLLLPPPKRQRKTNLSMDEQKEERKRFEEEKEKHQRTRDKLRKMLQKGALDERDVEMKLDDIPEPRIEVFSSMGLDSFDINVGEILSGFMPGHLSSGKRKKMKVSEALEYLFYSESKKLVDMNDVKEIAISRVEENGIVFLDEIDKIAGEKSQHGPDVSREGVQRDLLPIIEGTNVPTKYGMVDTTHILFIASGAFHVSKPSDLIPELQGRFPIRVELKSLTEEDFAKILTLPKNALIKQYTEMLKTEDVDVSFTKGAIREISSFAAQANNKMEDIGARRLHTVLSILLEDYLYELPDSKMTNIKITKELVTKKLDKIITDEDLTKYIL
ncbi:MAG TPA: ATP-dependent protease ATPase subunit HslU [Candidatus Cloacimonetes bacterium]|nr:ATP-dependent protease ATPase subunit HslU [Candidatus Cloacimonadota bacterium]HEX37276.1 ATP-dependent protease ATPase subunit HslU [Candidatus Cloacimonadota bacterium]